MLIKYTTVKTSLAHCNSQIINVVHNIMHQFHYSSISGCAIKLHSIFDEYHATIESRLGHEYLERKYEEKNYKLLIWS